MNATSILDFQTISNCISFLDSLLSVLVILAGVYVYRKKKDDIISLFNILKNYELQRTIEEINTKLDELNKCSAEDTNPEVITEIASILKEIKGIIKVTPPLYKEIDKEIYEKLEYYATHMDKFDDPERRGLISEVRGSIKLVNLISYTNFAKEVKNGK
jgi:hypothetical protein